MAKYDIRELNYITAGNRQNTFNVSYSYTDDGNIEARNTIGDISAFHALKTETLFGNIARFNSMDQQYASNEQSFFDISANLIIHNLYPITKTTLQTTAKKHYSSGSYRGTQDILVPALSSDLISLCQFSNYAYGLTDMLTKSPATEKIQFRKYASAQDYSYAKVISSDQLDTYLYHTPQQILNDSELTSYQQMITEYPYLSSQTISAIFNPKKNLKGIEHNYLLEIPEGTVYNDYEAGYIQCDMNVMKNHLNYLYSMDLHDDNGIQLLSCRQYCKLDVCGDELYATYRTNVNYSANKNQITYNDSVQELNDKTLDDVDECNLKKNMSDYAYQHVEIIEGINRYDGALNAGHKSSMFSIRLIDTGLNESKIRENVKKNLRQNIKNNLRQILETIIPANTQLFDIYFEGQ